MSVPATLALWCGLTLALIKAPGTEPEPDFSSRTHVFTLPPGPIGDFEQRAREHPNDSQAWFLLGLAYDKTDRTDKAIDAYRTALRVDPKRGDIWFFLGSVLARTGRDEEAFEPILKATQFDPGAADGWAFLSELLTEAKKFREAEAAANKAIKLAPQTGLPWGAIGIAYAAEGRYEDSAEALRHAIKLDPKYEIAWRNLASSEDHLQHFDEAIVDLKKSIALNPKSTERWNSLAGLMLATKDEAGELDALEHSVAIQPDQPEVWPFIVICAVDLKRWQEAYDAGAKAVDQNHENHPTIVSRYAVAAYEVQQPQKADALMTRAQAAAPDSPDVLSSLGLLKRYEQQWVVSKDAYTKLVATKPEAWWGWDGLAFADYQLGKYTESIEACRQAAVLDPDDTDCWATAYQCYSSKEETDWAVMAKERFDFLKSGGHSAPGAVPILPPL